MCEPLGDPTLPRRVGSKVIRRRERSEDREPETQAAKRNRVRVSLLELTVIQIACCLPTASPSRLPGSLLGRAVDRSVFNHKRLGVAVWLSQLCASYLIYLSLLAF